MRHHNLFIRILPAVLLFFGSSAVAQKTAVEFPATPLGEIAGEWVAVINNGDDAKLKSFIENRFSTSALRQQKPETLFALFRNLQKQSGGIELVSVTPNKGEMPMFITLKSAKAERYASVIIGMHAKEGKLAGIGIQKIDDPAEPRWATVKLNEREMIGEIRRRIAKRAANGDFSGVVLVAKDERILLNEAFGEADREAKIANTPKTQFHLASVGKMFTSAAIATLVRAGKLSYDDTVAEILPDYPNPEIARKVTLHQLLTHTAGFGTFFESPGFDRRARYRSSVEEIDVYKDEPLFFEPGAKWRYSNAGYSLLGAIIERVSGRPYLEYVRENVFKPLGMNETDTNSLDAPPKNGAVLYQPTDVDPFGLEALRGDRGILNSPATGFGGGFSTAEDLFKFARSYRTGKLLGKELTERVVAPKFMTPANENWGYGIKEKIVNGEIVRGHSGGGRADVAIVWNSGYTVVVLVNVMPPTAAGLSEKIVDLITYQESLKKKKQAD